MGVWSPIGGTRRRPKLFVPCVKSAQVGDPTPAVSIARIKAVFVDEREPMPEKADARIMIYLEQGGIWRIEIFDPRGRRVVFYSPEIPFMPPRLSDLLPQTMQIIEEHKKTMKGGK
jgi:hypothetical protein